MRYRRRRHTLSEEDNMKTIASATNHTRFRLGELQVVALRDGYIDMPTSCLRQAGDKPFPTLPEDVQTVDGQLRLSVNAFLVLDAEDCILIDTGAANAWEPTMGGLLKALEEAGVAREKIRTVALTHTHEDHVQGLVADDGADAFPNLERLFVPREEIPLFDRLHRLQRFLDLRTPLDGGYKLSRHVRAVSAHGHEVGHTVYEVTSAGETLLIWGDTVHVQSIQFAKPDLTWEFDTDQDMARTARLALLRRAAEAHVYVAGAHLDFPGVGKVTGNKASFPYRPL